MKLPKTHAAFVKAFPRTPMVLSDAERHAIAPAHWHAYTAPEYGHLRSTNTLGTWTIGHPRDNGTNETEPVDIKYAMPMPAGETYPSLMKIMGEYDTSDELWWRAGSTALMGQDLGYFYNQDYAKDFVDRARMSVPDGDAEAILRRAGFVQTPRPNSKNNEPTGIFSLKDEFGGEFTVFAKPSSLSMTHSKKSAHRWSNLMSVSMGHQSHDEKTWIPRYWAPDIADPMAAAADMAVHFAQTWRPVARIGARKKTKP